ncbi:MAG TPA: D-alanyl-D-alanine carboxypeptidase family protein [Bacillales bacterium]|nr:D-alanyl-D-alanine carboxypeptidase family protein [Bacillales bacterium]
MKRIFVGLMSCILVTFAVLPARGFAEEGKSGLELAKEAKSAILIEADTGKVLYAKQPDKKLPPASMTKIMTMLLIMEALNDGRLSWDEKVRTSEHAASMGGSQVFLEPGEKMTVKDMLKAIAIGSANDASMAMAEKIGGSEEAFVKMMNEKAEKLGLQHTHFENPTGLPAENHYSSARDMAKIARALLAYDKITEYTGKYEDYLREDTDEKFWLVNTNRLVKFYPGVDGLKTGYTNKAKFCLTATAKKDGMRVIAVVMGADTAKARNNEVSNMLDYAFGHFQSKQIYAKGTVVETSHVDKGVMNEVPIVTARNVSVLTKKGESVKNLDKSIVVKEHLRAPLKKGQKVGKLVLKKDGKTLSETPLVTKTDVPRASWWNLFKHAGSFFVLPSKAH